MTTRPQDETVALMFDQLNSYLKEIYNERAGIREFDGLLSRQLAEAMAMLDVLELYPSALDSTVVLQVLVDGELHFYVANAEELAREQAEKVGGEIQAQTSFDWCLQHQFGSLAELIVAA